ncbi:hypothetical protein QTH34_02095 [Clostridium perfringens]|uniref:hypothetical protein n=1 Tax=Clostridium perfringens TaxID=1502 RepID=UPI0013E34442|nr:hypothetical protein [Clostridium perfringens]MDB2044090.1 hypothetical protein [Clostridium perfringens]MDB2055159.1 hypothetical protein [Clostridium perfringens]MDK0640051.1 hypothetical protein [Clostridium perfringens]MDK0653349.1 hypothetical protein [Clostridium perfringens]MDK0816479.1 hypothetical protein [Clostridium perfringens]
MALTNAFNEAVNSNNVRRVRIMMKDSLLVDPKFNLFKEMDTVASKMQGLYQEHDGRAFNLDKSTWNKDYMNKLMVQVVSNFSHERVNHLKDVVRYLNPISKNGEEIIKSKNLNNHRTNKELNNYRTKSNTSNRNIQNKKLSYEEQKALDKKKGTYRGTKIASGALVGALVGGTAASLASLTVVGGTVAGAVVGGTVVAIVTNKE